MKSPQALSPRVQGGCSLPWGGAAPGRWAPQGASYAALPGAAKLPRPEHPCGGAAGRSPWLRRSRCLAPHARRGPLSVHLPAGMASFDPIAPTQWLSPPCWAAAARSALQPPSPRGPRRSGTRSRGAPSLRRGYLGWIALGAAAAAAGAAGPPPSWPWQGRSANSQLWRGRARRVRTRPGRGRDTPRVLSRPQLAVCPQFLPTLPHPTSPTSHRFSSRDSGRQGFRPGTFSKLPALPGGALSQFGTPQALRDRLQIINPVGEDL